MVRGYDTFKERLVYSQNGTSALTRDDFRRKLDPSATVPRMSFFRSKKYPGASNEYSRSVRSIIFGAVPHQSRDSKCALCDWWLTLDARLAGHCARRSGRTVPVELHDWQVKNGGKPRLVRSKCCGVAFSDGIRLPEISVQVIVISISVIDRQKNADTIVYFGFC